MQKFLMLLLIFAMFVGVLLLTLAISFFAYWLVLKAGAPNYVAVIVGIAVFLSSAWFSNRK